MSAAGRGHIEWPETYYLFVCLRSFDKFEVAEFVKNIQEDILLSGEGTRDRTWKRDAYEATAKREVGDMDILGEFIALWSVSTTSVLTLALLNSLLVKFMAKRSEMGAQK